MDNSKTASRQAARKRRLLINRDFTLLWSAQAISKLGDVVFDYTLVFWIATSIAREQRWAPLAVSGIFVATALPTLGAGPIAGVFVDRWQKRPTMLLMDALRAILILLLLLATGILPPPFQLPPFGQLVAIYLVVVLATICAQFFDPSRLALVGDMVTEPDRAHATGLLEVTRNLAVVVGPPVAALLYFRFGALWALIINALSFVVSFLALLAVHASPSGVRPQPEQQTHFLREFVSGLHFLAGNRVLMTILVTSVVGMFGFSAFSALGIFFALQNLHYPCEPLQLSQPRLWSRSHDGCISGRTLCATHRRGTHLLALDPATERAPAGLRSSDELRASSGSLLSLRNTVRRNWCGL